ncbi:hypothetical protein N879_13360 [Alcaligenes sp. EGD-AK7]|nr:hypothetical protein N879_13360 [Alcaligenes sp. EGD-AK7]
MRPKNDNTPTWKLHVGVLNLDWLDQLTARDVSLAVA